MFFVELRKLRLFNSGMKQLFTGDQHTFERHGTDFDPISVLCPVLLHSTCAYNASHNYGPTDTAGNYNEYLEP